MLQVYPKRDITNIVESSHYLKIGSWCRAGSTTGSQMRGKCKTARWVKPFRCLGKFSTWYMPKYLSNTIFYNTVVTLYRVSHCWIFKGYIWKLFENFYIILQEFSIFKYCIPRDILSIHYSKGLKITLI